MAASSAVFSSNALGSTFDKDNREECGNLQEQCTKEYMWSDCPLTCSVFLMQQGGISQAVDPESFYQLEFTTHEGRTFDLEDYQGYVTLFATVPLVPGMAQYYYDMVHYIQTIFPYTLETIVQPLGRKSNGARSRGVQITPRTESKVALLKTASLKFDDFDYFKKQIRPVAGSEDLGILMDRVTFFIISTNGKHVERLISPTMKMLSSRVQVFLKELDENFGFGREL